MKIGATRAQIAELAILLTPPEDAPRTVGCAVDDDASAPSADDDDSDPVARGAQTSSTCEEAWAIHCENTDDEADAVHWLAEADREAAAD